MQLHGPSALLPRKEFPEFVSFNYKYPITISQSVTSQKYMALFYFSYLYTKKNSTLTDSLFLLFLILSYVCRSQNVSHNKSLFFVSGLISETNLMCSFAIW